MVLTVRLCDLIANRGVDTVRDVLVLGQDLFFAFTKGWDRNLLDRTVHAVCPDEPWLDQPTAADIAKLCVGLDQVHAGVLPAYRRELSRMLYGHAWERVGHFFSDLHPNPDVQASRNNDPFFVACRHQAIRFAAEFMEAKRGEEPMARED